MRTATALVEEDPDSAASRAYYAAFYAASAVFALEDKYFTKHRAIEAAVHRDFVRTGRWSEEDGTAFSALVRLRTIGDYGMGAHVSVNAAREALKQAEQILTAVRTSYPDFDRYVIP
jgi:uncharacterized protein (UPF0332 family)